MSYAPRTRPTCPNCGYGSKRGERYYWRARPCGHGACYACQGDSCIACEDAQQAVDATTKSELPAADPMARRFDEHGDQYFTSGRLTRADREDFE